MNKVDTKTFYVSSEKYDKKNNFPKKPNAVFRQELATWEHTTTGIKKTTLIRSFNGKKQIDSYISEPITFKTSNT